MLKDKSSKYKKAGTYLIELLIVVAGVSIAFQLNVWKEKRKEKQLEDQLLLSFRVENQINIKEMDSAVFLLQNNIKIGLNLIELLKDDQSNIDSIRQKIGALYSIYWPNIASTHLENYLSFNTPNSPIREELLSLKWLYSSSNELSTKYVALKEQKLMGYLSDVVDITDGLTVVNQHKLFAVEFRNNLFLITAYEESLAEILTKITISQLKSEELIVALLDK